MQKLYDLRYLITEFELRQPNMLQVSSEENKKLELFINDIKKQSESLQQGQNVSACELIVTLTNLR